MLKTDLHIHTIYSDGDAIDKILYYARKRRLEAIALTDHNTTKAIAEAENISHNILVIPGVELETELGHILVLGTRKTPPLRKASSYHELLDWAAEENAVTILAHPAATPTTLTHLKEIASHKPTAVETHNALYPAYPIATWLSGSIAAKLGAPRTGGSDSHTAETVGLTYTLIDAEKSVEEILEAIRKGYTTPQGKPAPIIYRLKAILIITHLKHLNHSLPQASSRSPLYLKKLKNV